MLCLDIGHYGNDSGATYNGMREDNLAKMICDRVGQLCKTVGIEYILSTGSLQNRCYIANSQNCDIFVSVHVNSFSEKVTGVETLVYDLNQNKTRYKLANIINRNVVNASGLKNRGLKARSDLYVLKKTNMSACLVECGFINNDWANVNKRVEQFAQGIFNGLKEYYNISSKCAYCGK